MDNSYSNSMMKMGLTRKVIKKKLVTSHTELKKAIRKKEKKH
jgi:hypothetical protein